jgi:F-type H+-transporting ATPase subunit b
LELNWSTFLLEIINFLVLVWILKRFFYQPLLDVIARRRASVEQTLNDAKARQADAETLKARYENRLSDWEQERRDALASLERDIETERTKRLAALQAELADEREKARIAEQRSQETARLHAEQTALAQGSRFATRLLSLAAGPELEQRLATLLLDDLAGLPAAGRDALRVAADRATDGIVVTSAWPLDEATRRALEEALGTALSASAPVRYEQDPALLAGLRVTLGSRVLRANLQDELQIFSELAHDS